MREDLATSLERLGERAAAVLPSEVDVITLATHVRSHRIAPGVFGRYYDLVTALQTQDWTSAARLWREIAELAAATAPFAILPIDDTALGNDGERYRRMFTLGLTSVPQFTAPDADDLAHMQTAIPAALDWLKARHAAWAAEIRSLVGQVVAIVPPSSDTVSVSGGSSMMLWGAVLIQSIGRPGRLRILSTLAHEATHQLLFGLARSTPPVTNPVEARFCTELRPTPRPMNAVYHSTYVSGRIHALFEYLKREGDLSQDEQSLADETSDLQRRRFDQGCAVILDQAQLTDLGRDLIVEARDYMA